MMIDLRDGPKELEDSDKGQQDSRRLEKLWHLDHKDLR